MRWNEDGITSLIALIVKETIKGKSIRVKMQLCTALQYCTVYTCQVLKSCAPNLYNAALLNITSVFRFVSFFSLLKNLKISLIRQSWLASFFFINLMDQFCLTFSLDFADCLEKLVFIFLTGGSYSESISRQIFIKL